MDTQRISQVQVFVLKYYTSRQLTSCKPPTQQHAFVCSLCPLWFVDALLQALHTYRNLTHVCNLIAWVIYEHLITLDREIRCVWFHKFTKGSVIFYLNRYAVLSMVIVLLIKDNIPSVHVCDSIVSFFSAAVTVLTHSMCFCDLEVSLHHFTTILILIKQNSS